MASNTPIVGEIKEFEVASSGKMMSLFADSVYKHKIPAAIREIIFNASDAHKAALCADAPIVIHLPKVGEQYFAVKDFGTGMPHDFVMGPYTIYGFSTKDKGSATGEVGKLGLGSKAPLAVAESFELISRHDGTQGHYRVFWNDKAKPQVECLSLEPTKEPNGVEVRWNVPSDKLAAYRDEIKLLCSYFRPLPVITGLGEKAEFQPAVIRVAEGGEGKGFRFRAGHTHKDQWSTHVTYTATARAVMGMIVYPITVAAIDNLTDIQRNILALPLDIDFPVGALEFTPGREDLSYDEKTIKALKARLNAIATDMRKVVDDRYGACETRFVALNLYGIISRQSGTVLSAYQRIVGARWRKETLTSNCFHLKREDYPGLAIKAVTVVPHTEGRDRPQRDTSELDAESVMPSITIQALTHFTVYVNDLEKGAKARFDEQVRYRLRSSDMSVMLTGPQEQIDAALAYFEGVNVRNLSEFVPEKVEKRKVKVRVLTDVRKGRIDRDTVRDYDVGEDETGFYVLTKNFKLDSHDPHSFQRRYEAAVGHDLFKPHNETFIIVPASLASEFEGNKNWKLMGPELDRRARKFVNDPKTLESIAKSVQYAKCSGYGSGLSEIFDGLQELGPFMPKDHALAKLSARINEYGEHYEDGRVASIVATAFGINPKLPDLGISLWDEWEQHVATRYPLLPILLKNKPRIDYSVEGDYHEVHAKVLKQYRTDTALYISLFDAHHDPKSPTSAPIPAPAGRREARGSLKAKPWKVSRGGTRSRLRA